MYGKRSLGDDRKAFSAGVGREVYMGDGRVVVEMRGGAGSEEDGC